MKTSSLQTFWLVVLALITFLYLLAVSLVVRDFLFCEGGGAAGCGVTSFFVLPLTAIFGLITFVFSDLCKRKEKLASLNKSDNLIISNWRNLSFWSRVLFKIIVIPPLILLALGFAMALLVNVTLPF